MATSGTTSFTLDIIDIIEEAYELNGNEMRSGYDMKTARRSLDLLMREWGNRGINFWTIKETQVAVAAGTQTVTLDPSCIDILDAAWRTGTGPDQIDRTINRISVVEWSQTSNKNATGSPTQYWVNRTFPAVASIWPIPAQDGILLFYGIRTIQDAGAYGNNMDIPPRFLPAMTTGLAYYLAIKSGNAQNMVALKQEYDRQFQLASEEDRERAPFKLVPDFSRGGGRY